MPNNQPESSRPPERKAPNLGGNVIWYLLALAIATLFVVNLVESGGQAKLSYTNLERLIDKGPKGSIKVKETIDGKEVEVEYSHLQDLRFGPHEITGQVTKQVVGPETGKEEAGVVMRTDRLGLENDNNALADLAQKRGFNIRGEPAPSGWKNLMPMFIFMVLIAAIFFIMMRRLGRYGVGDGLRPQPRQALRPGGHRHHFQRRGRHRRGGRRAARGGRFSPVAREVPGPRRPDPQGRAAGRPAGHRQDPAGQGDRRRGGRAVLQPLRLRLRRDVRRRRRARVRDMFQQAQAKAPCIVFIDELDALGKTRGTSVVGGHDEREQTLNALLVEMDGFSSNSGVIVMAATNRPETLDPALLRPGRFDRHVLVDRPDVRGREEILKVHVGKVKLDESVDLKAVARITSGFVGADLANLVNEAALLAARKSKPAVTMDEFNEGVERVTAGLEKKQRVMHADEKQRVAYHESAHALVAYSLPNTDPVHKVSIIPRGLAALGYTMQRPEGDRYLMTQSELESRIQVLLAGTVGRGDHLRRRLDRGAERPGTRHRDRPQHGHGLRHEPAWAGSTSARAAARRSWPAGDDFTRERTHSEQTAREIDEEIARIIDESLADVRGILQNRRKALVGLAERLIEKEVIDTDELHEVVEANSPSAVLVPGTADAAARRSSPEGAPSADAKKPDKRAETG